MDIDTKFARRVARLLVDEGDVVRAGQVVAVTDTRDLEAWPHCPAARSAGLLRLATRSFLHV
ncbi:Biotin-lipoyl like [Methylobacterium sp. UNC378MF]|uniref:hypothetical protein n=1 Tax=Methylobacterium sp. UNC378MF TaxID=1502748 RepID=UPI0008804C79|nr:Biotin-lipoyl like [Methylobacterium sp. UNC378MF]